MKSPKLRKGDLVSIPKWYDKPWPIAFTVTRVGRFMVRLAFPFVVREFVWVPLECCKKLPRRNS